MRGWIRSTTRSWRRRCGEHWRSSASSCRTFRSDTATTLHCIFQRPPAAASVRSCGRAGCDAIEHQCETTQCPHSAVIVSEDSGRLRVVRMKRTDGDRRPQLAGSRGPLWIARSLTMRLVAPSGMQLGIFRAKVLWAARSTLLPCTRGVWRADDDNGDVPNVIIQPRRDRSTHVTLATTHHHPAHHHSRPPEKVAFQRAEAQQTADHTVGWPSALRAGPSSPVDEREGWEESCNRSRYCQRLQVRPGMRM